jgi:hypothetical protein
MEESLQRLTFRYGESTYKRRIEEEHAKEEQADFG